MVLRLRPLSEDSVDVYTQTYSVFCFLFLALLTLLVPAGQKTETEVETTRYRTSCWCPAQFEKSQVDYTNAVCARTLNNAIRSGKELHTPYYRMPDPPSTTPVNESGTTNGEDSDENNSDDNDNEDNDDDDEKFKEERAESLPLKTPVVLFVLALCLRLPHLLCSILSQCMNCVNLDQTLQSAGMADSLDETSRRRLYDGLVRALLEYIRPDNKASTCLYVFKKVFIIIVVIAEIVVVAAHVYPSLDAKEVDKNDKTLPLSSREVPDIYTCSFEIRHFSNVHQYAVQCLVEEGRGNAEQEMNHRHYLVSPSNVFALVLVLLTVLAAANLLNTLALMTNLCTRSSRKRMGLHRTVPLDLTLLIHLARTNLSVGAATGLAEMATVNPDFAKADEDQELFQK